MSELDEVEAAIRRVGAQTVGDEQRVGPVRLIDPENAGFTPEALDILAEVERVIGERDQKVTQEFTAEIADLVAKNEQLLKALRDFRDHGTRHDTNPTLIMYPIHKGIWPFRRVVGMCGPDIMWWYGYIKRMDDSVRRKAAAALEEAGDA